MPTPVKPNMTGPDQTDVAALMNAMESLHQISLSIRLFTLPMGGVGDLGVLVEAERRDGTLGCDEPLSLVLVQRLQTVSSGSIWPRLFGMLSSMDGGLSRAFWEQVIIPDL